MVDNIKGSKSHGKIQKSSRRIRWDYWKRTVSAEPAVWIFSPPSPVISHFQEPFLETWRFLSFRDICCEALQFWTIMFFLQSFFYAQHLCNSKVFMSKKKETLNKLKFKLVHACGQIFGFYWAHNWKLVDRFTTSRHTRRIPFLEVCPCGFVIPGNFSWRHCCCSWWMWRGLGAPQRCCYRELCGCWAWGRGHWPAVARPHGPPCGRSGSV